MAVVSVNPFRCRVWAFHDRLEESLTVEMCREQIESFREHGQVVPTLGRRLQGDPNHDVEIIYGARRLFAAQHLNQPLLVELRDITDREALIAMDVENRQRVDISPYERGLSYNRWLRCGFFTSQAQIARSLNISHSHVSRLLKLARLPAVIINAFGNAASIREEWGLKLAEALEDHGRRVATIRAARTIAAMLPRPQPNEVFRQLQAASVRGRKLEAQAHDQIVADDQGAPLFRIRQQRHSLVVMLPLQRMSQETVKELQRAIVEVLQKRPDCVVGSTPGAQSPGDMKRRTQSEFTSSV